MEWGGFLSEGKIKKLEEGGGEWEEEEGVERMSGEGYRMWRECEE